MKGKWQYLLVAGVFLIWIMACGLPFTVTTVNAPTATPEVALTALKALETLLTPLPATPTSTITPPPTATFTPTVTTTATATATASPIATSTAAPVLNYNYGYGNGYYGSGYYNTRPAGSFWATHLWSMPSINGSSLGGYSYPASALIYGSGSYNGSSDLSSSFNLGWDSNYLYVAAKVIDDVYCQNASGQDIYKGDSIEILLDADINSDYYSTVLNSDDYQLVISPGKGDINGPKEAVMYFPSSGNGDRENVNIGSSGFSGGYRVSAAIPWSDFNATASAGKHFGFAFSVSDNDDCSKNVQQSMVSSLPGRKLTNPTTWGTLILGN